MTLLSDKIYHYLPYGRKGYVMIDPKLYTFLKVAEYESFTMAARSLNLTQPAVSQHMRALESELGVKLTRRTGNTIRLTKEGEKALTAAKSISSVYTQLKNELSETYGMKRELTIGITHTVESSRITEVLARYASENTGARIRLISGTQSTLLQQLSSSEIDLAITDGPVKDDTLLKTVIDTDRLALIVSPGSPLARKTSVSVDDIKKEKMIVRLPGSGTGNMFLASLRAMMINIEDFNIILEIDNIATIKDLIQRGYGVSVMAESACLEELEKHTLTALPIDQMKLQREISGVCRKNFPHMDFLREIISLYRNENLPLS